MQICINCDAEIRRDELENITCLGCDHKIQQSNGIPMFSPELANQYEGYDSELYCDLVKLETGNYWFSSRNLLIIWILQKYVNKFDSLLEIGCGTGFVLDGIIKKFNSKFFGSEIYINGLEHAIQRVGKRATFLQMDATRIPYKNEFSVIGAFDVIEHIADDLGCLQQINKALQDNGKLILTVPQHMFLWSLNDELGKHYRRYSKMELCNKVKEAGFKIIYVNSFMFLLMPLMLISRMFRKKNNNIENFDILSELRIGTMANRMLKAVLSIEIALTKIGMRWPCGGSLILIAQKR